MTWLLKSDFLLCNIIMNWFSFSTSPARSNVHSILLGRTNKLLPKSRMIVHKNLLPQKTSFVDSHQQRWPNGSISGKLPMSFWVCLSKKRGCSLCYLQLWPKSVILLWFSYESEIDGKIEMAQSCLQLVSIPSFALWPVLVVIVYWRDILHKSSKSLAVKMPLLLAISHSIAYLLPMGLLLINSRCAAK